MLQRIAIYPAEDEEELEDLADLEAEFASIKGMRDTLPTGNELMSGPIREGGAEPSRQDQEIEYVMNNIQNRLFTLKLDEIFQTKKVFYFMIMFTCAIIGMLLFLYGMSMTVIFDANGRIDYAAIAFACVFWIGVFVWLRYILLPEKKEGKKRRKLAFARKDRRKPTLFNQLVEEANKATEPPPYKTRVIAHFRKKEYPITAPFWKDFCESLNSHTGLPIERMLIRYNDVDLDIDLAKGLHVEPYNIEQNGHLWVYNRGGYFTQDSKVKYQYEEMTAAAAAEIQKYNAKRAKRAEKNAANTAPGTPDTNRDKMGSRGSSSMKRDSMQGDRAMAASPSKSSRGPPGSAGSVAGRTVASGSVAGVSVVSAGSATNKTMVTKFEPNVSSGGSVAGGSVVSAGGTINSAGGGSLANKTLATVGTAGSASQS